MASGAYIHGKFGGGWSVCEMRKRETDGSMKSWLDVLERKGLSIEDTNDWKEKS